ncbi:MAG: hypothetical protein KGQ60_02380 [Planctomycetes bacterium]|nr:hypothetical protein [Planctomycetota bacterium]
MPLVRSLLLILLLIAYFSSPAFSRRNSIDQGFTPPKIAKEDRVKADNTIVQSSTEGAMSPSREPADDLADDPVLIDALTLIRDKGIELGKTEMQAYWKLLERVRSRSWSQLRSNARHANLHEFFQRPAEHRGEIVLQSMVIRRINRYSQSSKGGEESKELYEVWGTAEQTRGWFYVAIVPELPHSVNGDQELLGKRAELVGYFFKLQGFFSGVATSKENPSVAPMVIGRLELTAETSAISSTPSDWVWVIISIGGCSALALIYFHFLFRASNDGKPRKPRIRVEQDLAIWLDSQQKSQSDSP